MGKKFQLGCVGKVAALFFATGVMSLPEESCLAQGPPANETVTDAGDNGGPNQLRAKLAAIQGNATGGNLNFNIGNAIIVLTQGVLPAITKNTTIDGGGVVAISGANANAIFTVNSAGTLTLNNLTITRGFASGDGGAIRNSGTLNANNCKFTENQTAASWSGGAILSLGPLNLTNCEFALNKAGNGGAIYPRFSAAVTKITGCNFHDNTALNQTNGWGGAMLLWDGAPVTIADSVFSANTARHSGGAVYVQGASSLTVLGTQFTGNAVAEQNGGAIFNGGTVSITAGTFMLNSALGGGAISALNGTTTLVRSTFVHNWATDYAGACDLNGGTFTATDSTFTGNGFDQNGMGATSSGGAIDAYQAAAFNLTNVTMSGNFADFGGGIAIRSGNTSGNTLLQNVTLSGNHADLGGGLYKILLNGTLTVRNTIFANNTGGNCNGGLSSIFSLSSDGTCGMGPGRDNVANISLGPLTNNGGPTETHLPQPGSAAIDGGTAAGAPALDQRGYVRAGAAPDVGAAEFGGTMPTPTASPTATPTPTATAPPATTPTATPTVTPTTTLGTTLANISTRLPVQTGDNVLIGGFIVTGTQPKKVIIRALGPSVPVPGSLADPTLELFSGNTLLQSNDNWMESPNPQAIIDSTIPPTNPLESAIVALLPANNSAYTAVVRGANGGTGIGIVEAYDLDRTVNSKLANISTRGFVQTGDNVLIAGTIIVGQANQKILVRAIGPSLSVTGKMENPTLELRDGNGGLVEENDDWVTSANAQAIIDSTIPPANNLESAIVRTLSPAAYTAIVRGANSSTGIAVVEVYAIN